MPYDIRMRSEHNLILAHIWGNLDNELFRSYIDGTEKHAPIPADYRLLLIFDEETRLQIDPSLIRELARRPPVFDPDSVRLIVANQDLAFGLSRIYISESPSASEQYQIVRTLEEAIKILAIDANQLSSLQRQV